GTSIASDINMSIAEIVRTFKHSYSGVATHVGNTDSGHLQFAALLLVTAPVSLILRTFDDFEEFLIQGIQHI
ncbi:7105_t:CDS:1, partial [Paraglomus brasilianum]